MARGVLMGSRSESITPLPDSIFAGSLVRSASIRSGERRGHCIAVAAGESSTTMLSSPSSSTFPDEAANLCL